MFYSVVFMQGDDAAEPLDILERDGADAAVQYLAQWDYGDETQSAAIINGHTYSRVADAIGTGDRHMVSGPYVLTWNDHLGYVGLLCEVEDDAPSGSEVQTFIDAAVDCIGWTTHIDDGNCSDILGYMDGHDDWDSVREVVERENREELEGFAEAHYGDLMRLSPDMSQHGHDYVLTAGGHGAGFWDRGYPADIERPVTESARMGTSSHMAWIDDAGTLHYAQG